MQVQDIYKLVYQSAMGMKHLIEFGGAKQYFIEEYNSVQSDKNTELFENIHPESKIFRIDLRKAKAESIDKYILWKLLIKSANSFEANEKSLRRWWQEFCQSGLSNNFDDLESFNQKLQANGFQAYHHSEIYRKQYSPSYRLITDGFAKSILRKN